MLKLLATQPIGRMRKLKNVKVMVWMIAFKSLLQNQYYFHLLSGS